MLFFHFKETIEEPHQETNSQQKENQSNDIKIEHCVKIYRYVDIPDPVDEQNENEGGSDPVIRKLEGQKV